jgi:putative ABC transport system permease protein
VISNTFSITVAQRTRENALLRAIGASRKQVMRSVMLESLLTGVVASAIGVVAGIATAMGLEALLGSFGVDLPEGDPVVAAKTVIVSMAIGITVTLVAAYLPARRAAKVPPIAALRDVALDRSGRSLKRTIVGAAVSVAGIALLAVGLSGGGVPAVGLGALTVFVGVAVLGPVVARPVSQVLGSPLPLLRGMTGTIARENAIRNPKRTSATASALMIGVGLIVFITVFGASARASIAQSVDDAMLGDWVVDTTWGQGGLSPEVAATIDALPESGAVTAVRYAPATIDGTSTLLSAVTAATAEQTIDFGLEEGSISTLGSDGLAVRSTVADAAGWTLGDRVELTFAETGTRSFEIDAIYTTREPMGDYAVSTEAFDANVSEIVDALLVISNADGVSMEEARAAIGGALADYPTGELQSEDEFKAGMAGEINEMLNMVYALLALAVIIALFGIANTLALSVHERTRELGLLRAVGMGRGQVRSAVRWESVIIALLGTSLGLAIGLGFGWALVRALASQGFDHLAVPTGQLAMVVLFGAAAGIVAAALPARRAAEVDVLTALQSA